jgi:hypothetical protein
MDLRAGAAGEMNIKGYAVAGGGNEGAPHDGLLAVALIAIGVDSPAGSLECSG